MRFIYSVFLGSYALSCLSLVPDQALAQPTASLHSVKEIYLLLNKNCQGQALATIYNLSEYEQIILSANSSIGYGVTVVTKPGAIIPDFYVYRRDVNTQGLGLEEVRYLIDDGIDPGNVDDLDTLFASTSDDTSDDYFDLYNAAQVKIGCLHRVLLQE